MIRLPVRIQRATVLLQAVKPVDSRPVLHEGRVDVLCDILYFSDEDDPRLFLRRLRLKIDPDGTSIFKKHCGGLPAQCRNDQLIQSFLQFLPRRIPESQNHGLLHPRKLPHG